MPLKLPVPGRRVQGWGRETDSGGSKQVAGNYARPGPSSFFPVYFTSFFYSLIKFYLMYNKPHIFKADDLMSFDICRFTKPSL